MCIYYVKDLVITSLLFLCFLRAQTAHPNLPVLFRPQEKQLLQGESHLSQTCTWDAQKWFKTEFPCVDTSFRTSNTNLPASCCYPLAEQGIYPQAKIISKAQVGGPARRRKSNLGGCEVVRQRGSPLPPLPWPCVPLFLYTKTICFSCSNEEQCLPDKGASSLLLCCLWLALDAGKNGNSQRECLFFTAVRVMAEPVHCISQMVQ